MTMTIFHEGTALAAAASQMGSAIISMGNIQAIMDQIHGQMTDSWRGDAASQHDRNRQELSRSVAEYLAYARGTKQALEEAIAKYASLEQTQTTRVKALETKGIF